jgi:hypothetical protein
MDDLLKLKARHFKGAEFESNSDCALARAAKEKFNVEAVNASSSFLYLDDVAFLKVEYNYWQFKEDRIIAASKNYSDEVIRTLNLIKE